MKDPAPHRDRERVTLKAELRVVAAQLQNLVCDNEELRRQSDEIRRKIQSLDLNEPQQPSPERASQPDHGIRTGLN